jgi:hypothetical protein
LLLSCIHLFWLRLILVVLRSIVIDGIFIEWFMMFFTVLSTIVVVFLFVSRRLWIVHLFLERLLVCLLYGSSCMFCISLVWFLFRMFIVFIFFGGS